MEGRMNKCRQVSPERAKIWKEKSPKYHYNQQQKKKNERVSVVYYLFRNRQLEHPHLMEVPLSSPDGLYLRDVIERLNVLRGRGMASMYSWSCKRSYKNGFVWHDLCDNDLILPANRNEYVLKGSELFEESNSGSFSPLLLQNQKALQEPSSSRIQDESSSSSSLNGITTKSVSPLSREFSNGKNSSWDGSLSLMEYKVYKNDGFADASTQTEENSSRAVETRDTCSRGVSTDDGSFELESSGPRASQAPQVKETSRICREFVSPSPSTSSASSSTHRTDTLESLIRADGKKFNSFRILEEEEFRMPSSSKLKASSMIMQLISCGALSVKDHCFGLIPSYKPSFSHSKFSSPLFSMHGELDWLADNSRLGGMRLEDKEYFSGSLLEMSKRVPTVKRSSSFNADRSAQQFGSFGDVKNESSIRSKCIPIAIKASHDKQQPRCESMRFPLSEGPRFSYDTTDSSWINTPGTSNGRTKRMTDPFVGIKRSSLLQELGL